MSANKSLILTASLLLAGAQFCLSGNGTWTSKALGTAINYTTSEAATPAKDQNGKQMTVVYLENLGFEKLGQNTNAQDVAWLREQGYRVVELDYGGNGKAVSPYINQDIIAINDALNGGTFCGCGNCSPIRSYVLMEGWRIARDVSYFLDDPSVYNWPGADYTQGDSLYMDIVYPANASEKVPCVLSFSYSNSSGKAGQQHQRLFLGYTLSMFDDSFLEGAPARGIAWAIADHPKYADWGQGKPAGGENKTYASYETNPDAICKVKSAVRTLRAEGQSLGLSGEIGIYGFSRGSTAGSLAVGDRQVTEYEAGGRYPGVSSAVQAAALGPGVFDYTLIYEITGDGDKNLENGCPKAWGALASNREQWERQGAVWMAQTAATAPVLFFYNTSDEKYYQIQQAAFQKHLQSLEVPVDTLVDYGSGHSVPTDGESLGQMYDFMERYLAVGGETALRKEKPERIDTAVEATKILSADGRLYLRVECNRDVLWYDTLGRLCCPLL